MRQTKLSQENVRHLAPEELRREALASNDGLLISELMRKLDCSDAPVDFKVAAVTEIAKAHPEMTHIVIGCLSTLIRLSPDNARHFCRVLVNAPFNPDRDLIVAHAAATLTSIPNPDPIDAQLIAKAILHRSEQIQTTTRRAVRTLSQSAATNLLSIVETLPPKPAHDMLKRLLQSRPSLPADPPQEMAAARPPAGDQSDTLSAEKQPQDILAPLVLSTPVLEALRRVEQRESSPRKAPKRVKATRPVASKAPTEEQAPPPKPSEAVQNPAPQVLVTPSEIVAGEDPLKLLHQHRLKGFHLLSDSALTNTVIISKNYREVGAALVEFTIRHGTAYALQFNSRLLYALGDPDNMHRGMFNDIASVWFRIDG